MLKNLDPKDISIKPFKSFKNFTFTNNDSGSGVWLIKARSGSMFSYVSSSDSTTSIVSGSVTTRYFALPTWHTLNKLFYKDISKPFNVFSNYDSTKQNRELQQMFGVRGYPTIWFVKPEKSSQGKFNLSQIGSTGYVAGGPLSWIGAAENILKKK